MNHSHHQESNVSFFKKYKALILVLCFIVATVSIIEWIQGFSFQGFMRLFMGMFFLVFGTFKLLDWKGFVDAYRTYDVVAKRVRFYGYLYPLIELSLAVCYLMNWYPYWTNLLTLFVMVVSSVGVIKAVVSRSQLRCACLGTVVNLPMTTITIIEDLGMGVMALIMFLSL